MKHVYLDQNKWIDLSCAYHGRPGGEKFRDVLQLCFARREQGDATFPISAQHHMELSKRGQPDSRKRLADFMAVLSDGHTMASYTALVPPMIAEFCLNRSVRPAGDRPPVFGKGLSFAYGHAECSPGEWASNPDFAAFATAKLQSASVLADLLANPVDPMRAEMAAQVRLHGEKVAELAEGQRHARATLSPDQLEWMLLGRLMMSSHDAVLQACENRDADPTPFLSGPDGVRAAVAAVPPLQIELALYRNQVTQPQRKAHPNDMVDIATLSVVLPYCDVVVTERHWAHVAKQLGLHTQFGTQLLTDVNALADLL